VAIKKEAEEAVEVRSDEVAAKRKLVARDLSAHRDVVLPGVPSAPGKLATIQPFPHRAQARIVATSSLNLSSASQQTPKNNSDCGKSRQDLDTALSALNPDFRPLGFTINSLSSCSEGVLEDALKASQAAISTILSSIGPGEEASLWQLVRPRLDRLFAGQLNSRLPLTPDQAK